jgi:cytochrome P450
VDALEKLSEVKLPPGDFPPSDEVILVTQFGEAMEILRSSQLKPSMGSMSSRVAIDSAGNVRFADSATDGQAADDPPPEVVLWDDLFGRDLRHLHGTTHTQRRRALNPLFARNAHLWFRDKVIMPTLARNLANLLGASDSDGTPRADMVLFAKRVFVQATAALVGFDGVDTEAGADALIGLDARIQYGRLFGFHRVPNGKGPNGAELPEQMKAAALDPLKAALDAQTELFEHFYLPSLESRRQLVARHRAGELAESELPHDLLTLIAEGAAGFEDPQVWFPVARQLVAGSIGTNTTNLLHGIANLAHWFAQHPEDYERRTDPTFLEGALRETLRLHGGTLPRVALEDVTLSTGRVIKAGQYVALLMDRINRDRTVFGPDADDFDPGRVVPVGVYPFGLGFGSGAHMCIGLPLVMGQGGLTGMQVPVQQALQAAGVRPDPARPAEKQEFFPFADEYATFPVIFDLRG